MANIHAVVRTDRMFGTDNRAGLISIKYIVSDSSSGTAVDVETAIENGNVLKSTSLIEGEREVFKGVAPAADDDVKDIVLVASPELMYDERKHNLDDFTNEAGKIARAYRLHSGDIFSVTKEALDGAATPAVGDVVELKAGTKLNVKAAATGATSGSTVIGEIIAIDVVGKYTYYVILVD